MKAMNVLAAAMMSAALIGQAEAADQTNGKAIYMKWCSDCHAATGGRYAPPAGWNVLQKRYKGTNINPILDERTDLAPEYIHTMVRQGMNAMPRTRKTEITDAELGDLIAYLTRNNK